MDFIINRISNFFNDMGSFGILLVGMFKSLPRVFKDRMLIIEQMVSIGVNSFVLVSIIGLFTGAVSAWQAAYQMAGLVSNNYLGSATSKAIIIELGPVLAAIVLAGRVGASIAAELGTMKVTEQIDALEAMAINPIRYLAMPRVIATTVMLPILVIYAVTIAITGSFVVSTLFLDVSPNVFMNGFKGSFQIRDFNTAMIKAFWFGLAISSIGCFVGFETRGGAQGVGLSTIKSFVICAASILILDYILWNLLVG
ncbi:MAG: ABC transporter permease [Ignavibacteriae bacterium]|nr:ABC transporter permease [Ignavibacteriota bacterium]MCB9243214.1 ABC transporter permease [Ignavibacteriales bacterium]